MSQSFKQNATIGVGGRFDPLLGLRGCRKSLGIGGLNYGALVQLQKVASSL